MSMVFTIEIMERDSVTGGVGIVHWKVKKEVDGFKAQAVGSEEFFPDSTSDDFIAYEDLTEEIVVQWIKSALGKRQLSNIEKNLDSEIENQRNPPVIRGKPW